MIAQRVSSEAEVREILKGMGFSETEHNTATGTFWRHQKTKRPPFGAVFCARILSRLAIVEIPLKCHQHFRRTAEYDAVKFIVTVNLKEISP